MGGVFPNKFFGSFFHLKSYKTKSVMKMAKPKIKRKRGEKKYGGRICIHLEDNKRRWTKDGEEDTKKNCQRTINNYLSHLSSRYTLYTNPPDFFFHFQVGIGRVTFYTQKCTHAPGPATSRCFVGGKREKKKIVTHMQQLEIRGKITLVSNWWI